MKIGVTGYKGKLGSELVHLGCDPLKCDITKVETIKSAIADVKPDLVINCAAYTEVDACEDKKNLNDAIAVNTRGVDNLRDAYGGRLFHISTDYVFAGDNGPYLEDVRPVPVNRYGWSKYGGEVAFLIPFKIGDCLIRTTGLYGGISDKPDFVDLIINHLLVKKKQIAVTDELFGNQTYVPHLADALIKLAGIFEHPLILHIGSKDVISRFDFAMMIAERFKLNFDLILPVKTKFIPKWAAPRPTKGGLDVGVAEQLGLVRTVLEGLEDYKKSE